MNRLPPWYPRATWGMTLGLLLSLVLLLTMRPGVLGPLSTALEYDTLDFWFSLREPLPVRNVGLVTLDSQTLRNWNGRTLSAPDLKRTLEILKSSGARGVVLNLPHLDTQRFTNEETAILAAAIRQSPPVTLPLQFWRSDSDRFAPTGQRERAAQVARARKFALSKSQVSALDREEIPQLTDQWGLNTPPKLLLDGASGAGHLNFTFDRFGRVRSLPLVIEWRDQFFPALALSAFQNTVKTRDVGRKHSLLLNYPGIGAPLPRVSLHDLVKSPARGTIFRGRVVVLGNVAHGVASRYPTPTGEFVSATELQAIALDNLLSDTALRRAPEIWHWIFTILPAIIVGGFSAARRPSWSAPVALLCVAATMMASFGLFRGGIWMDTSVPWLTVTLTFLVGVIGRARLQERDATHIESTVEALTRVSDIVSAQTRRWDLMDKVLQFAAQTLRTSGAAALLWDENRQFLTFAATIGSAGEELLGVRLKPGEGVAGTVAQTGEAIVINDVKTDARFSTRMDEKTGFSTRALVCVPLRVNEKILGVIEVVNREGSAPFTRADAELLQALANQAAIALENARLYDQLNARVEQSQGALAVANRQLQADKALLQTVLHSMTDGVIVTDGAGRIQLVNPAAQSLLPELAQDVLGRPLEQVMEDFPISHSPRFQSEPVVLCRGDVDSPRQIEARAAPLQSPDGEFAGLVAAFSDITQRRRIEQTKSDFVSFVAHEMRSPLTSISGFSSMLGRAETSGSPLPAASKTRFLGLIREEAERLTRLINSLLDVAKLEAGRQIELNRDEFNFALLASAALESQRAYSSRHTLVSQFEPHLPPIYADADKVTQILINLLSNALKYSPGGQVTLGAQTSDRFLLVWVRDEGPGIAPAQREILFARFGRTPQQATGTGAGAKPTGTGLGLFLTKHLVEAHGGQIWAESEPGDGATFYFTLPLALGEEK